MPLIVVEAAYRKALEEIPYVVIAGESCGAWLGRFLGQLGLRAELAGDRDDPNRVVLTLTDAVAKGEALEMGLVNTSDDEPPVTRHGPIAIRGHAAFPPGVLRGALVDDPTQGNARQVIRAGPVADVLTAEGIDADEAAERRFKTLYGSFAESLMLQAASRQTQMHPGCIVQLDRALHGFDAWQIASVKHLVKNGVYDNDATLLRGDIPWHPPVPERAPAFMVSAVVDHGPEFDMHQPVPRDRLGRVKVQFPFTPTPVDDAVEDAVEDTPAPVGDVAGDAPVHDAVEAWPPRIALPVVEPMAGALHGFIPTHRQGDIARVVVHDPFHAEIAGFQYRNDRRINPDLSGALGGIVGRA